MPVMFAQYSTLPYWPLSPRATVPACGRCLASVQSQGRLVLVSIELLLAWASGSVLARPVRTAALLLVLGLVLGRHTAKGGIKSLLYL